MYSHTPLGSVKCAVGFCGHLLAVFSAFIHDSYNYRVDLSEMGVTGFSTKGQKK